MKHAKLEEHSEFAILYCFDCTVQLSSVKYAIYAFGKARMRSTPSLRSFPSFVLETVPTIGLIQWLTMALSDRALKEDRTSDSIWNFGYSGTMPPHRSNMLSR